MFKALYVMDPERHPEIYGPEQQAQIAAMVDVLAPVMRPEEALKRPDILQQVDILISGWGAPVLDKKFLDATPNLKAFFYGSGSVRGLISDEFWQRNLIVTTAHSVNAIPVAEFSVAHIILGLKRAWLLSVETKAARGYLPSKIPLAGAFGSTVGLISLSATGRLVRQRLSTFDVKVLVYDPTVTPAQTASLNVELVSLEEIFRRSDVVSLHAPHLPATVGLITGQLLSSMKPGATFINTARGAVVRESEMIDVLTRRTDLTAIIDVTYPEPPVADSKLYDLPNVVLTPHIAGSVENECRRMGQSTVDELRRFLAGEPLQTSLTREQAASRA